MTRFTLSLLLAAPLALAACGDPADTSAEATHTMPDGTEMAGAEHEHMTHVDAEPVTAEVVDGVQIVEIEAGRMGYQPRQIHLEPGIPTRLVFTRTVEDECSSQITIPDYGVPTTDLPLNEPVAVEFTPDEAGDVEFVCGMDMQRGTIAIVS